MGKRSQKRQSRGGGGGYGGGGYDGMDDFEDEAAREQMKQELKHEFDTFKSHIRIDKNTTAADVLEQLVFLSSEAARKRRERATRWAGVSSVASFLFTVMLIVPAVLWDAFAEAYEAMYPSKRDYNARHGHAQGSTAGGDNDGARAESSGRSAGGDEHSSSSSSHAAGHLPPVNADPFVLFGLDAKTATAADVTKEFRRLVRRR